MFCFAPCMLKILLKLEILILNLLKRCKGALASCTRTNMRIVWPYCTIYVSTGTVHLSILKHMHTTGPTSPH